MSIRYVSVYLVHNQLYFYIFKIAIKQVYPTSFSIILMELIKILNNVHVNKVRFVSDINTQTANRPTIN